MKESTPIERFLSQEKLSPQDWDLFISLLLERVEPDQFGNKIYSFREESDTDITIESIFGHNQIKVLAGNRIETIYFNDSNQPQLNIVMTGQTESEVYSWVLESKTKAETSFRAESSQVLSPEKLLHFCTTLYRAWKLYS